MRTLLPVASRRDVARAARRLIRVEARAVAGFLAVASLAAVAGLGGPALLGRVIDAVSAGGGTGQVDRLAGAVLLCALAQTLLARYALAAAYRFGERTAARIRETFLRRVLGLPAAVVERVPAGDLAARGSTDVDSVANALRDLLPPIFVGVVQIVFLIVAVVVLDPLLGVVGVIGFSGIWFVTRWFLRRARDAYLTEGEATSRLADELANTTGGARTIEAFGLHARRIAAGDEAIAETRRTRLFTLGLRSVFFPLAESSYAIPAVLVLTLGGLMHIDGRVSIGTVAAAVLYLRQLVGPLDGILIFLDQLQAGAASFARIEGLGSVPAPPPPDERAPDSEQIEVDDVRYAYDQGRDVLHDVALTVRPGERLAVVGLSGAGKSTLGRLIAGVDRPTSGTVTVGGVPIADLPPDELRRHVVLVTQEHHVFQDTLRANLMVAAPDERLREALRTVGADWADDLDRDLGEHPLDGAQAQQLALARVVLADPHTVILDEATALLDPTAARTAERALAAVLHERTVIAIAHRLQTAHDADRVAVMDDGRIIELGRHDDLVAADGPYAALWRSWHGGGRRIPR
ncbi:multidrug ABC transporter ATP-binding protein [Actinoplanes lobatus]|uniref:ABC-type multidrug transport system fused ATPase/permease subunit n=1 Tax=Actinoplanes lobatus TaxID=113568 RepID=A0A7W7HH48_9ACTN|nr:ABC transporter ATP-binding protein [Actinoplanes lobatus]MBB4750426.1 ABC-type multidrug transport system fused ATPase/permease subunit [Actinoplanes lobatus]GGN71967.1 multidrug ABC transporter ATP-binding protein [Actinoplanes lobatus]GIE45291.1 multidrug ABC transporter ATP-binding protein [Actinoplanes lobatus]